MRRYGKTLCSGKAFDIVEIIGPVGSRVIGYALLDTEGREARLLCSREEALGSFHQLQAEVYQHRCATRSAVGGDNVSGVVSRESGQVGSYETLDTCNSFELITILEPGTGAAANHAVLVSLDAEGEFRLTKVMDTGMGQLIDYTIVDGDASPIASYRATDEDAAWKGFDHSRDPAGDAAVSARGGQQRPSDEASLPLSTDQDISDV